MLDRNHIYERFNLFTTEYLKCYNELNYLLKGIVKVPDILNLSMFNRKDIEWPKYVESYTRICNIWYRLTLRYGGKNNRLFETAIPRGVVEFDSVDQCKVWLKKFILILFMKEFSSYDKINLITKKLEKTYLDANLNIYRICEN